MQDGCDGPEETATVKGEGLETALVQDAGVFAVIACFRGYLQLVTAVDLCPAGKPGLNIVCAVFVAFCEQVCLVPQGRTRADYRDRSGEDVPQLREFIEAAFSEESADFCYVLVGVLEQVGRGIVRSGHFHGAEFV